MYLYVYILIDTYLKNVIYVTFFESYHTVCLFFSHLHRLYHLRYLMPQQHLFTLPCHAISNHARINFNHFSRETKMKQFNKLSIYVAALTIAQAFCGIAYAEPRCDISVPVKDINWDGCTKKSMDITNTSPNATLSGASLVKVDLSNSKLPNMNLTNANLSGANLVGTNFSNANFSDANLYGVNLSNANLSGANLSNAILNNANLSNANLTGANLTDAVLKNANLAGANLTNATINGAKFTGVTFINLPSTTNFFNAPHPAIWINGKLCNSLSGSTGKCMKD